MEKVTGSNLFPLGFFGIVNIANQILKYLHSIISTTIGILVKGVVCWSGGRGVKPTDRPFVGFG